MPGAMKRLSCPFCGPRELHEFRFHKTLPSADAPASVFQRVYERSAERTLSIEHWQHLGGCRGWLLVRRDPSSGAVLAVRLLDGAAP
jgi:sarcosine oxidase subunit delta